MYIADGRSRIPVPDREYTARRVGRAVGAAHIIGWDFFRALLGLRACDSPPAGTITGRNADTLPSPVLPPFPFRPARLAEHGLEHRLVEERVWERREEFLMLNPAATTPVLMVEGYPPVPGAPAVMEFLDETRGGDLFERRLMPVEASRRIEVRRLTAWFNEKFFAEVSGPLVTERFYKRHMRIEQGGGPPDTDAIRAARINVRYHLAYIGWLVRTRNWLAGERMSFADLAAAAHLSSVDYLGDVPWSEDEAAKSWYARVKSRPSFRPILAETWPGLAPAATYTNLDF